ncbi:MAG: hypothetical protein ABIJ08_05925 [Nanoarchaeota archaeon]
MKKIKVEIEGVAPLLQHKMSIEEEAQLASKTKKSVGQNKGDNPEDFLYKVGNKICQPSEHILQAIIKRLGGYKIQGKGKKTYLEMGKGSLNIMPDMIPHEIQKWEVDSRTVVIKATRGRVVRLRPKFNEWKLKFTIELINDDMPVEVVKSALDDAGREGGLGDYRPRFGRFIVTSFQEVK